MSEVTIVQLSPDQLKGLVAQAVRDELERSAQTTSETWGLKEVANYCGVSVATVHRMEADGRLPKRIGRRWEKADVLRFLRDRAQKGHKKAA